VYESWQDPSAAWWAKARRASKHIQDIGPMIAEFRPATACEVLRETSTPGETDLRLHVRRSPSAEILTTIGDALHNMRSCLDSVAFELARRHVGESMTEGQRSATMFPLREDLTGFEKFLARPDQRDLYGEHERNALRCVQPFALREEAAEHGVSFVTSPQEEYRINALVRLSQLNNRDKHRYLPLLAWFVDFVFFTDMVPECRLNVRMHSLLQDGDLVGHVGFDPADADPSTKLKTDLRLGFADDPGYASDFMSALTSWHDYLTQWILPRIFIVAEGNRPPIAISVS
jgi:hypothetical protein